jgi:hypothetical protein
MHAPPARPPPAGVKKQLAGTAKELEGERATAAEMRAQLELLKHEYLAAGGLGTGLAGWLAGWLAVQLIVCWCAFRRLHRLHSRHTALAWRSAACPQPTDCPRPPQARRLSLRRTRRPP